MMEHVVKKRKIAVQELSDFIDSSQQVVENTLKALGWDEDNLNHVEFKTCPLNPEHRMPEKSLAKHVEICRLRQEGYSKESEFLPDCGAQSDSCILLDEITRCSVIHEAKKNMPEMRTTLWVVCVISCYRCVGECVSHPVPRTTDRVFSSATTDERLALYDYVVEKTKHRHTDDLPLDLPWPDKSDDSKKFEPKSLLEVRAQERDAKRRSVSYKKVHTSRKSHTEILKEVIQNQMEMLESCTQSDS